MRILLIGATGQIGYALTHALARSGHAVTILVRDTHGLPFPAGVRIHTAPVFTAEAFRRALAGADHVIYGVGLPEQFVFDPTVFERVNVGLLQTFLITLRETGPRSLTYISTFKVFAARDGLIRETHPLADDTTMTPYFRAMLRAYRLATGVANEAGITLTTIHPAAVYGGRDTGRGLTHYLDNLRRWRVWQVPAIVPGRFPVVHAGSLADAIILTLGHPGAYIVSDQMTTLRDMARAVRHTARSWAPPSLPLAAVCPLVPALERVAALTRRPPIMARVQLQFLTQGTEPRPDKIISELGWRPLPLDEGIRRYLGRA